LVKVTPKALKCDGFYFMSSIKLQRILEFLFGKLIQPFFKDFKTCYHTIEAIEKDSRVIDRSDLVLYP
jgi:hypothetical protein